MDRAKQKTHILYAQKLSKEAKARYLQNIDNYLQSVNAQLDVKSNDYIMWLHNIFDHCIGPEHPCSGPTSVLGQVHCDQKVSVFQMNLFYKH